MDQGLAISVVDLCDYKLTYQALLARHYARPETTSLGGRESYHPSERLYRPL